MPSKVRKVIETLFRIYDKNGDLVDFKLNNIQAQIDEEVIAPIEAFRLAYGQNAPIPQELQDSLRNSILKYRQGGVTTLIMAWYLVECMSHYSVAVMLTHDKEHSEKLLYRARLMLKNLKGPKPKTSKLNDNEIAFEKTQSVFYIGTAGSKEFGRSATITFLHCSEIAFWKDPASLMKSLFQAVPKATGVITQETTANGWGGWFQKSFYNYLSGNGGFNARFYPWYIHEEYVSNTPYHYYHLDPDELKVERSIYKLIRKATKAPKSHVIKQLQWRREKIDEAQGDRDRKSAIKDFNQEYPLTVREAFVSTGGNVFGFSARKETPNWQYLTNNTYYLAPHPRPNLHYSLGADYSGGTGHDYATIIIGCLETREQVLTFRDNYTDPVAFTDIIVNFGLKFNTALIVPEVNSHGIAGVALLKKKYPLDRIYKHVLPQGFTNATMNVASHGYGWKTTGTSKPYMVGIGLQFLQAGLTIHCPTLEDEINSFVEDPITGKMAGAGAHDDSVMAFLLMCLGLLKLLRGDGFWVQDTIDLNTVELITTNSKAIEVPKHTHRNQEGQYLIPFKDMFATKRRSAHK